MRDGRQRKGSLSVFGVRSGWRLVPGSFASGPRLAKIAAPRVQRQLERGRSNGWKKLKGSVERGDSAAGSKNVPEGGKKV